MDARVARLMCNGLDEATAQALVKAGLDMPIKVKRAKKLPRSVDAAKVRELFPKR